MSKFHLEFNGFAGFDTLDEARAAVEAFRKILENADVKNVGMKLSDMANKCNVDLSSDVEDDSLYTYGLQGSNSYIGKLMKVAEKFMKHEEYDIIDWAGSLLKIENQRYYVDVDVFKDIVLWGLKTDMNAEDFINSVPKQD